MRQITIRFLTEDGPQAFVFLDQFLDHCRFVSDLHLRPAIGRRFLAHVEPHEQRQLKFCRWS